MRTITEKKVQLNPELWSVQHKTYLFAMARRKLPEAAIEDVVQDTFLAALRSAPRFKGQSTERVWLTSILHHKIMDYYRKAYSRQGKVMHDALRLSDHPNWYELENQTNKPDDAEIIELLNADELISVFNSGLSVLGNREKEVLRLKMKGYSTEAICNTLDIERVNTWVALSRARKKMKSYLNENW
ncbi:sigma-70 family RNA polymerase sigma factor [Allomuricauda sp. XS_ASV26]|uniref:sigma-70 family RNA polymerase sigma factor n=1 Tax=Flavobacteriaceae TaxID=49546 RepID=UPI002075E36A|nr:sigma-70 family RNA polymerase sigma factor [Allomuricauda aquimarina]USD24709.1 sigma-70 family RNA polymerase sigma factor [Allomuricauda aquimarina]